MSQLPAQSTLPSAEILDFQESVHSLIDIKKYMIYLITEERKSVYGAYQKVRRLIRNGYDDANERQQLYTLATAAKRHLERLIEYRTRLTNRIHLILKSKNIELNDTVNAVIQKLVDQFIPFAPTTDMREIRLDQLSRHAVQLFTKVGTHPTEPDEQISIESETL